MECLFCGYDNLLGAEDCARCGVDLSDLALEPPSAGLMAELTSTSLSRLIPPPPSSSRDSTNQPAGPARRPSWTTVSPEAPLGSVLRRFLDQGCHCAVVVDQGKVVGVFTERDVLMKAALESDSQAHQPIRDFMTARPETADERASVAFGLDRMTAGGYRHIPVLRGAELLGVVSVMDALAFMVSRYPAELGNAPSQACP